MDFVKYQHVERYGNAEVEGIEAGTCYVFPKIDGTNASVWLGEDGVVHAGSLKRELALDNDNAGFMNAIVKDERIKAFLKDNPSMRLYGEWLVPHSLKTYRDDAWRKFYVFDVCIGNEENGLEYLPYPYYSIILQRYNIDYIAPIRIIRNGGLDKFVRCLEQNDYLIKDGEGAGEGIVIKDYDYKDKYGRQTWAKLVTSEFKDKHRKEMGAPVIEADLIEARVVDRFVTNAFVEKEYAKIANENNGWTSKMIPQLLSRVFHELICEEMWNILKVFKNPAINFKVLNNFTIAKIKEVKPELF